MLRWQLIVVRSWGGRRNSPIIRMDGFTTPRIIIQTISFDAPRSWKRAGYFNAIVPHGLIITNNLVLLNKKQMFEIINLRPMQVYSIHFEPMRWIDSPSFIKIWQGRDL